MPTRRTFALGATATVLLLLIACDDSATSSSSSGARADAGTKSGMNGYGELFRYGKR